MGAHSSSLYKAILESLLAGNGSAFTSEVDSIVYARALADSRAIVDIWSSAKRLSYAADPDRMTEPFLSRWESILGLNSAGLKEVQRRANIKAKMQLRGKAANLSTTRDLLVEILGDVFGDVVYFNTDVAVSHIPGGITIPGGQTLTDGPWSSHVNEVYIRLEKPATMTDLEFTQVRNVLAPFLDPFLPAWCDWSSYAHSETHGTIGFFLDEPNLSLEAFS